MRTAKQLLQTYLAAISAGETEKAIALFADDGGVEFPYFGSVNLPTRYQGPDALRRFFGPVVDGAENFKFKTSRFFLVKTKITSRVNTRWMPSSKKQAAATGSFTEVGSLQKTEK
jgi:hypothetical protein